MSNSTEYNTSELRQLYQNSLLVQHKDQVYLDASTNNDRNEMALRQTSGNAILMRERVQQKTFQDYLSPPFICNVPNKSEIKHYIRTTFRFENPTNVYAILITRAKNCLPKINLLAENYLNYVYSQAIDNNLVNLYTNSPKYFNYIVQTPGNFKEYQIYLYLLVHVWYIVKHREEDNLIRIDRQQMPAVIEWCRNRMNENVEYQIQGPLTHEDKVTDFISILNGMLSMVNTQSSIAAYLQVSTMQAVNEHTIELNDKLESRPNVYFKNPNIAGSYTIQLDTDINSNFQVDQLNNLYMDFTQVDLGTSIGRNVNLNYHDAEVNLGEEHWDPKTASRKLQNLMNQFTMFKIKSLLVLKTTYKTSLDNFDNIYIVFPGINIDGKFNQVFNTGCLQVSGKFIENNNEKYWEFVPNNENGVVYKPTTAEVNNLGFYISDKPNSVSHILYNNFKIETYKSNYFNCPIIVQNFDNLNDDQLKLKEMYNLDFTQDVYLIRSYKIGNDGKPSALNYSFLYNKKFKYIQLLNNNYDLSTVPLYYSQKLRKTKVNTTKAIILPNKPEIKASRNVILDLLEMAESMEETKIFVPNSMSYITRDEIEKKYNYAIKTNQYLENNELKHGKTKPEKYAIDINNEILEFSSDETPDSIDKSLNWTQYDMPVYKQFTQEEIDQIPGYEFTFMNTKFNKDMPIDKINSTIKQIQRLQFVDSIVDIELTKYKNNLGAYEQMKTMNQEQDIINGYDFEHYYRYYGLFKPDINYTYTTTEVETDIIINNLENGITQTTTATLSDLICFHYMRDENNILTLTNSTTNVIRHGDLLLSDELIILTPDEEPNEMLYPYYQNGTTLINKWISNGVEYTDYEFIDSTGTVSNKLLITTITTLPDSTTSTTTLIDTTGYLSMFTNSNFISKNTESVGLPSGSIQNYLINGKLARTVTSDDIQIKGSLVLNVDSETGVETIYSLVNDGNQNGIKFEYQYQKDANNMITSDFTLNDIYSVVKNYISEDGKIIDSITEYKQISIPYTADTNMYKTFKIETDILSTPFSTTNFIYSLAKLNNKTIISTPYYKYVDYKLSLIGEYEKIQTQNDYSKPIPIKYYISYINDLPLKLVVNYNNFDLSGTGVKIGDVEYVMKQINSQLFSINYSSPISDSTEIKTINSRLKLMIELN